MFSPVVYAKMARPELSQESSWLELPGLVGGSKRMATKAARSRAVFSLGTEHGARYR